MLLYRTKDGAIVAHEDSFYFRRGNWDTFINRDNLFAGVLDEIKGLKALDGPASLEDILPPIGTQEVWAAGVTYFRSREARMEESKDSGGASFYDMVYEAERPEIFFKAIAQRVVGQNGTVNIRRDSTWNVPEPELTLFINSKGSIQGYTVGNDMSSRSIEGENPLYLPQAKSYERSAALGPCLFVSAEPIAASTAISMQISRNGVAVFNDAVEINRMKRKHTELAEFLFRECEFPYGCFLMTGTCLVPPNNFTLVVGDKVDITIEPIGTLTNYVGTR